MEYRFYYPDFRIHKEHTVKSQELNKIFGQPIAFWYGSSPYKKVRNIQKRIKRLFDRSDPYLPYIVIYSIPDRDLGHYAKGGESSNSDYIDFIKDVSRGIEDKSPIVIYEPDALAQSFDMKYEEKQKRIRLIRKALKFLHKGCNAKIYLDVGHPYWLTVDEVINILSKFDKESYEGFALNTSNFVSTEQCMIYGDKISNKIDKHYVIDTSRNGFGYTGDWCNPTTAAIGNFPTTETTNELCDAFLWIKPIGESDGKRNGGPKAGRFYYEYALKVIENSKKNGSL
jgi:endoglucanase